MIITFNEENIEKLALQVNEILGVITVDNVINEFLFQNTLHNLKEYGFPSTRTKFKPKILKVLHSMVERGIILRGTSFGKGHPYVFFTDYENCRSIQTLDRMMSQK